MTAAKAPGQFVDDRESLISIRLIPRVEGAEIWSTEAFSNSMPGSFSLSTFGR